MEKDWHLDEPPFLDVLDKHQKKDLFRFCSARKYTKGEHIFNMGDQANYLYLIQKGKVMTYLINEQGEEIILSIRAVGNIFGLSSIFGKGERVGYATTIEDTDCLLIHQEQLCSLLRSSTKISNLFIQILGKRLCQHRAIIQDILGRKTRNRLARLILRLNQQFGCPHEAGILLDISITQDELSSMISARRQTVNRILKAFECEKLIKLGYKRLIVTDINGLKKTLR